MIPKIINLKRIYGDYTAYGEIIDVCLTGNGMLKCEQFTCFSNELLFPDCGLLGLNCYSETSVSVQKTVRYHSSEDHNLMVITVKTSTLI
jgi:hypothetical protein